MKRIPALLLLIATVIFFIQFSKPFRHPGFFPTQDDVQVVRIQEMLKELKSGQFPVRYIDTFGRGGGYMLFNYYSPLPYYVGAVEQVAVTRAVKATKIVFLTALFIGSMGIFVLLRRYTSFFTALLGVCLLLSSAYVGYDVYIRGALAEVWGMMLFPWVVWGFLRAREKPSVFNYAVAGTFYAAAILSHIAIAFVLSFFLAGIALIPPRTKKNFIAVAGSAGVGLLLSAFFWLPILLEQKYISYASSGYATTQYLVGFLSLPQITGLTMETADPHATLGLGLFILTAASIVFLFLKSKNKQRNIFLYSVAVLMLSLLLTLPLTKSLWDAVPQLRYLQSPWRFLTIATVFGIFISGLALFQLKHRWVQLLIVGAVVFYAFRFQSGYMKPYAYNDIPEYRAEGPCATTTFENEYLPTWVKQCLHESVSTTPSFPIFSAAQKITAKKVEKNGRLIQFRTDGKAGEVTIAKYYFPSWNVLVDGVNTHSYPTTKHGLITFYVPEGSHGVTVELRSTPVQTAGNVLSLGGVLLILIVFAQEFRKLNLTKIRKGIRAYFV